MKQKKSVESSLYLDFSNLVIKHCEKRGIENPKINGKLYNDAIILACKIDDYINEMCDLEKTSNKDGRLRETGIKKENKND